MQNPIQIWSTGSLAFRSEELIAECLVKLNSIFVYPVVSYNAEQKAFEGKFFEEEFTQTIAQYVTKPFSIKSMFHTEQGVFTGGWVDFFDAEGNQLECVSLDDLIAKNTNNGKSIVIFGVNSSHQIFEDDTSFEVQKQLQEKINNGEFKDPSEISTMLDKTDGDCEHHEYTMESFIRTMNDFDPVDNFIQLQY